MKTIELNCKESFEMREALRGLIRTYKIMLDDYNKMLCTKALDEKDIKLITESVSDLQENIIMCENLKKKLEG